MARYQAVIDYEPRGPHTGFWRLVNECSDDNGANVERHVLTKWSTCTLKEVKRIAADNGAVVRVLDPQ
jgi:hypothetical protein